MAKSLGGKVSWGKILSLYFIKLPSGDYILYHIHCFSILTIINFFIAFFAVIKIISNVSSRACSGFEQNCVFYDLVSYYIFPLCRRLISLFSLSCSPLFLIRREGRCMIGRLSISVLLFFSVPCSYRFSAQFHTLHYRVGVPVCCNSDV